MDGANGSRQQQQARAHATARRARTEPCRCRPKAAPPRPLCRATRASRRSSTPPPKETRAAAAPRHGCPRLMSGSRRRRSRPRPSADRQRKALDRRAGGSAEADAEADRAAPPHGPPPPRRPLAQPHRRQRRRPEHRRPHLRAAAEALERAVQVRRHRQHHLGRHRHRLRASCRSAPTRRCSAGSTCCHAPDDVPHRRRHRRARSRVLWLMALLAWRTEELRLRSSTMTEVAIRLAEPDRLAEQSAASLGPGRAPPGLVHERRDLARARPRRRARGHGAQRGHACSSAPTRRTSARSAA